MAIHKGSNTIEKLYVGKNQIGKVYKGSTLIYQAESDEETLSVTVNQGGNHLNYNTVLYTLAEDYDNVIFISRTFGTSFGEFVHRVSVITDGKATTLCERTGAYTGSGYSWGGTDLTLNKMYPVKKGSQIELRIGASYNPNVSTPLTTGSSIKFYFT